jgi:hypothetical protein
VGPVATLKLLLVAPRLQVERSHWWLVTVLGQVVLCRSRLALGARGMAATCLSAAAVVMVATLATPILLLLSLPRDKVVPLSLALVNQRVLLVQSLSPRALQQLAPVGLLVSLLERAEQVQAVHLHFAQAVPQARRSLAVILTLGLERAMLAAMCA